MDDVTRRAMLWGAGASVAATGLITSGQSAEGSGDVHDVGFGDLVAEEIGWRWL